MKMSTARTSREGKIFCIGFHKTGTSSLRDALSILGYRVTGPNWTRCDDIASTWPARVKQKVPKYDAFQDNPWPVLFRELDEWYPGSRFILSVRPTEQWLQSAINHFGSEPTPMRQFIYGEGAPLDSPEVYVARYESHIRDVRDYFKGQSRFLEVDVTSVDPWVPICRFLGFPVPSITFPHSNAGTSRLTEKMGDDESVRSQHGLSVRRWAKKQISRRTRRR